VALKSGSDRLIVVVGREARRLTRTFWTAPVHESKGAAGGSAFEVEFSDGVAVEVAVAGALPSRFSRVGLSFSGLSCITNFSFFSPRPSTYLTGSIRINPDFNFK